MTDTRTRLLDASVTLFGRQGYTGTGLNQIVAEAKAALGSLYHFFPGGKRELGAEAVALSGAAYGRLIDAVFDPAPDVVAGVDAFFVGAAQHLVETGYADACPIATLAGEVATTDDTLRAATAEVFAAWTATVARRLADAGVPDATAGELATLMLATLEGAFLLCRAARDTTALDVARRAVTGAIAAALPRPA